jgi:hypothetical protein
MLGFCVPECNFISLFKRKSKKQILSSTAPFTEEGRASEQIVDEAKALDMRIEDPAVVNEDATKIQ